MQAFIHLSKHTLTKGETVAMPQGNTAVWVKKGSVQQGSKAHDANDGFHTATEDLIGVSADTEIWCFSLGRIEPTSQRNTVLVSNFDWPKGQALLRLDTVTFPKSAIAYRHTHAGAGIRCLVQGGLEIHSDHHTERFEPGQAWFEDINSPVKAIASDTEVSQFIRALILPVEFAGKTTITFLNPDDFEKPKLQSNHRFFDQAISF
jgi:hypothetical protein